MNNVNKFQAEHGKAITYALMALWVAQSLVPQLMAEYPGVKWLTTLGVIAGTLWKCFLSINTANSVGGTETQ